MDRRLGVDIPKKLHNYKVYLTATKEYQDELKKHKQKLSDDLLKMQQ